MKITDIDAHARRYYEAYGSKAMAIAAQRAAAFEDEGDEAHAKTWRRIEASIAEMRGAPPS
ncbi:MAG: hypothetical protein PVI23_14705 [Maricaulaceae bacterium]|jgi:hypothetical protein